MSNLPKDHTSVRVHAPPGGHSNHIFGTSDEQSAANKKKNSESHVFGTSDEQSAVNKKKNTESNVFGTSDEQSAANKKKNSESNIFGSKPDHVDSAPAKPNRNTGNNIFGTDPEENNTKAGTLAGQYKQTQMKSNIFGTDEPTSTRTVSDKNKSNIFGIGDNNDQNKRQGGGGRRDPNASRMGYNPINGEAYAPKDNVNSKTNENDKQPDLTVKAPEEQNVNAQAAPTDSAENNNAQVAPATTTENGNVQAAPAKTSENGNAQKLDNAANGNNAQKNVHTNVRIVHPPGGKSNGPLW
jgi:hypothetical protein